MYYLLSLSTFHQTAADSTYYKVQQHWHYLILSIYFDLHCLEWQKKQVRNAMLTHDKSRRDDYYVWALTCSKYTFYKKNFKHNATKVFNSGCTQPLYTI
jgi:hypothetical protein